MPRTERPLEQGDSPLLRFAADLRRLREQAGNPPYRQLARRAHCSAASLSTAASGRKLPSLSMALAYVRACEGDVEQWQRRWHAVAAQLAADRTDPLGPGETGAPYAGTAVLQPADAERFFGRERLLEELAATVARRRVTVVSGPSGVGVSSLLRAGLVARLRARRPGDPVALLTPGARPLTACAGELSRLTGVPPDQARAELATDPGALRRLAERALDGLPGDSELVLVVDQAEELFTQCRDARVRARFLAALLDATRDERGRCRAVLAVWADHRARLLAHHGLARAASGAELTVRALTPEELHRAITAPAVRAGCAVEGALLAVAVAGAAGHPGLLPWLSRALLETWRRRSGNALTLAGFHAGGGVEGALAQAAETWYTTLEPALRPRARDVLLRLAAPAGGGAAGPPRRIERAELDGDGATAAVLDRLAAARLVVLDHDGVALVHGSLADVWPRLRSWLAKDREALRVHRDLTAAAHVWERAGHDPEALYRGARLAVALRRTAGSGLLLTAAERRFLDASARRAAGEHRRARRLRRLLLLLLALSGGLAAHTAMALCETPCRRSRAVPAHPSTAVYL
ncbi:nSTAND1 domain-containing NTPase [Streptomyces capparidis]